jgi:hypothetical protein
MSELVKTPVNISASGPSVLVPGVAGKTIRVYRLQITVSRAATLIFENDDSSVPDGPLVFPAAGSLTWDNTGEAWFVTGAGKGFQLNLSAAVQVAGNIWYVQA